MSEGLQIKKLSYSRAPWRICIGDYEMELMHFDRKRDAQPFLERIAAIGDTSSISAIRGWSEQQRALLDAIVRDSPGYATWSAAVLAGQRQHAKGFI